MHLSPAGDALQGGHEVMNLTVVRVVTRPNVTLCKMIHILVGNIKTYQGKRVRCLKNISIGRHNKRWQALLTSSKEWVEKCE